MNSISSQPNLPGWEGRTVVRGQVFVFAATTAACRVVCYSQNLETVVVRSRHGLAHGMFKAGNCRAVSQSVLFHEAPRAAKFRELRRSESVEAPRAAKFRERRSSESVEAPRAAEFRAL